MKAAYNYIPLVVFLLQNSLQQSVNIFGEFSSTEEEKHGKIKSIRQVFSLTECNLHCLQSRDNCDTVHLVEHSNGTLTCQLIFSYEQNKTDQHLLKNRSQFLSVFVTFPPRDCLGWFKRGYKTNGVYTIYLKSQSRSIEVYCDMTTKGGGWILFQRRFNGNISFDRDWQNYKEGFGDVHGEFWLGNEYVHLMTNMEDLNGCEMMMKGKRFNGKTRSIFFRNFQLLSEKEYYKVASKAVCDDCKDMEKHFIREPFSSRDENKSNKKCPQLFKGGWWYPVRGATCSNLFFNGYYSSTAKTEMYEQGLRWKVLATVTESLKETWMGLRCGI